MELELQDHTIETNEAFTIAGVAKRGTDVDPAILWTELDDVAEALHDVTTSNDQYGVIFEVDEDSEEFTYLVGHPVESTDDLPPEASAVEIPAATYAVFQLQGVGVNRIVKGIDEGMLSDDDDHEHRTGPVIQHYTATDTPTDAQSEFELLVPVEEE